MTLMLRRHAPKYHVNVTVVESNNTLNGLQCRSVVCCYHAKSRLAIERELFAGHCAAPIRREPTRRSLRGRGRWSPRLDLDSACVRAGVESALIQETNPLPRSTTLRCQPAGAVSRKPRVGNSNVSPDPSVRWLVWCPTPASLSGELVPAGRLLEGVSPLLVREQAEKASSTHIRAIRFIVHAPVFSSPAPPARIRPSTPARRCYGRCSTRACLRSRRWAARCDT